jgi:hypothetical protein
MTWPASTENSKQQANRSVGEKERFMKRDEKTAEPPSCLRPPIFMIGRDSRGNWVAQEQSGARGGLFSDRVGALKFAKSENGGHAPAVVWVSGVLELDTGGPPPSASAQRLDGASDRLRRVA